METSDSDYFESADEDLMSSNEKDFEREGNMFGDNITNTSTSKKMADSKITVAGLPIEINNETPNLNAKYSDLKANLMTDIKYLDSNDQIEPATQMVVTEKQALQGSNDFPATNDVCSDERELHNELVKESKGENFWNDDDEIAWGTELNEDTQVDNNAPNTSLSDLVMSKNTQSSKDNWSSWGNWGVSSILHTASSFTAQVSQGFSAVIENSIGVPDPEELARTNKVQTEHNNVVDQHQKSEGNTTAVNFGLDNIVSGVSHLTKLVESTSTLVISGGLDTLETIGKKTMEVLQDGDPGLKRKRAFLNIDNGKPVLSQVLREAKERASEVDSETFKTTKRVNYEILFDDNHGLVHLEALEMLSKQCDIKLKDLIGTLSADDAKDLQETWDQIKELCELPEDEEEPTTFSFIKQRLEANVKEINIDMSYHKLISTWEDTEIWLNNSELELYSKMELHQRAIETLAKLTALAVEQFHKAGELLLVKEERSTADEADGFVQLTVTLKSLMVLVASEFVEKLKERGMTESHKEKLSDLITNVFFEADNSATYVQNAFQLLIPVFQVGAQ